MLISKGRWLQATWKWCKLGTAHFAIHLLSLWGIQEDGRFFYIYHENTSQM